MCPHFVVILSGLYLHNDLAMLFSRRSGYGSIEWKSFYCCLVWRPLVLMAVCTGMTSILIIYRPCVELIAPTSLLGAPRAPACILYTQISSFISPVLCIRYISRPRTDLSMPFIDGGDGSAPGTIVCLLYCHVHSLSAAVFPPLQPPFMHFQSPPALH